MKDKNVHKKYAEENLPEPGFPVDEAWKQMHTLLVEHKLTQPEKDKRRRYALLLLIFFLFIGSLAGYVLINSKPAENKNLAKKISVIKKDSESNNTINSINDVAAKQEVNIHADTALLKNKTFILFSKTGTDTTQNNFSLKNFVQPSSINKNITGTTSNEATRQLADQLNNKDTLSNQTITGIVQEDVLNNSKPVNDLTIKNNTADSGKKTSPNSTHFKAAKLHFGIEWNADFSLKNNAHYFNSYNGAQQYYMWALPSAWAKIDVNKKSGLLLTFNPYRQQFMGNKTVHIEKPWIASVEPDVVTKVVKTRGINLGLQYEYTINRRLTIAAGADYTFIQNILFNDQSVEGFSGNILSEKIYGTKRKDASFSYIKPSTINGITSLQYNINKLSIGIGIHQSLKNIATDSMYSVRPLNGTIFIRYHFK